ncbi:MAG: alpha/beta hydrolase [Planctomycetes bacterium]|nr:alpha/beta hydrolase [Planctomycetota bacterium]
MPQTSQIRSTTHLAARMVLLPVFFALLCGGATRADDAVRIVTEVPYKLGDVTDGERERCKLDFYVPAGGAEFATIVWFHGGALEAGDKSDEIAALVGRRFATDGVAVASAGYRLHPDVTYPAYVEDAAAAVAFVRREIVKYGGSPRRLFLAGHSAGGYLTAMVGTDERYLAAHGVSLRDVAGLMPVAGQMITHSTVRRERGIPKTRPTVDDAAPCYYASANCPPLLCIAGSDDLPIRAEENRFFVAAMKAAGHKDATYLEVEGRDHITVAGLMDEQDDVVARAMLSFIERLKP